MKATRLLGIVALAAPLMAVTVSDVRVAPEQVAPGQASHVMFKLDAAALVTLRLRDLSGTIMTTLLANAQYPAGQFSVGWDPGAEIANGFYRPEVVARDTAGGAEVSASLNSTIATMEPLRFSADDTPAGGKTITYTVEKPAFVAIRVGINNGPMYRIIVDWQFMPPGTYTVPWDGWDENRVVNASRKEGCVIDARCIPVQLNALRVSNAKRTQPAGKIPAALLLAQFAAVTPRFSAVAGPATPVSIPLRIAVDAASLAQLNGLPFEYVLYIDGARYDEIENARSPYTWDVSRRNVTPGEHVFTLMLCTSIEQVNSRSFKITVQ